MSNQLISFPLPNEGFCEIRIYGGPIHQHHIQRIIDHLDLIKDSLESCSEAETIKTTIQYCLKAVDGYGLNLEQDEIDSFVAHLQTHLNDPLTTKELKKWVETKKWEH